MTASLSICVFCGFSAGADTGFEDAAQRLGTLIAAGGHRLVYGAGTGGLMGALGEAAAKGQGDILGVVPNFLRIREQADQLPEQNLLLTADLLERKSRMIEESDGFIALPGGYGTLDEVLEIISMKALGVLEAPLVLVNVADAWTPFTTMIDSLFQQKFIQDKEVCEVVGDPQSALRRIETATRPGPSTPRMPATEIPVHPARSGT